MRRVFLLVSATLLTVALSGFTAIAVLHMGGYAPPSSPPAVPSEEFVGPFASWTNVKTACGAVGDGSTDDTAAIQTCMNGLSTTAPVLYFPAGTYKITACLHIGTSCTVGTISATTEYIGFICQDPVTTTILWAGASGGTMMYLGDMIRSTFARCTFNGNNLASILIAEDQPGTGGGGSGVIGSNQFNDIVFENAGHSGATGIGFQCGISAGCSEVVLLRDKFINNSSIGAITMNFNALNMWCWYCLFQNNDIGIGDFTRVGGINGAGAFHAFKSSFSNSTNYDIAVGNIVEVNAIGNYSSGSGAFMFSSGTGGGPYPVLIQGNTVLDTTGTASGTAASILQNDGVVTLLLDNTIRSLSGATGPVVDLSNGSRPVDLLSVGNTLTVATAGNCAGASLPISVNAPTTGSRCHEFGDQTVSRSSINPPAPVLPSVPPNNGRTIFDAAALNGAAIQAAINSAAAGCVNNVAHIPAGTYAVSSTITVPANCRVQIIGDGWNSVLNASGSPNPVLKLNGPSQATLREFNVSGTTTTDAIEIDTADQPGSVIYGENLGSGANTTSCIFVDRLDNARIELHDLTLNGYMAGQVGTNVVGGPLAAAGNWQGGSTDIFAVNNENMTTDYTASNGSHLLAVDDWTESPGAGTSNPYTITGANTVFTHAGASISITVPLTGPFLNNFQGTSALLAENFQNNTISLAGNATGANDLILGDALSAAPSNTTSPAGTLGFLNSTTYGATPPVPLAESGTSSQAFLTSTLSQLRSTSPIQPVVPASGITGVGMWHVGFGSAKCGLHIEAGTNVTC